MRSKPKQSAGRLSSGTGSPLAFTTPSFDAYPALVIDEVRPELNGGRWAIKRLVGDMVEVTADVFKEGHHLLAVRLLWREAREPETSWQSEEMAPVGNDRWQGRFNVTENTRYAYTIEAYTDVFGSWRTDLLKRVGAGQDVSSELLEGRQIVGAALDRTPQVPADRDYLADLVARWDASGGPGSPGAVAVATSDGLAAVVARYPDISDVTRYRNVLEVIVDRVRAGYATWYEIFPRSQGTDPSRSATFREAEARLPAIAAMGFDVLYLTPIHPIGTTNRKGRNNTLAAGPKDPGSPYAIGNARGGHTAIAPELGTLVDFQHFQAEAKNLGMELALDFAIQVSPDHPWVREHPDWFHHRPDGTIKFAENPPKKYEDIYPLNFRSPDWKNLWAALRNVVLVWAEWGVRIIRVDNPHTKPLAFWEWLIRDVQSVYPDMIFLAEAFTRPKVMLSLAKAGFTQSYTYFTWRNTRWELEEYLNELSQAPVSDYFRGNFFTNTPDILPEGLQLGGRPAFRLRLILAATLSPVYGMYSGFELCENTPREPESEYYLDSEMYEQKVRDWNRPGNIIEDVRRVNQIRRENPCLQRMPGLRFHASDNDQLIVYSRATEDGASVVLTVVNLDPFHAQAGWLDVDVTQWGFGTDEDFEVHDLLGNVTHTWRGPHNWVRLDPQVQPAHVMRLERRHPVRRVTA